MESIRLKLRPAREADFLQLLPLYNKQENMQYILDGRYHWTVREIMQKWELLNAKLGEGFGLQLVLLKESGTIIGEAGILQLDRSVDHIPEIGFMLDTACRGQGLGIEVVKLLLRFAFEELGLSQLRAGVLRENQRSRQLIEKAGFRFLYSTDNPSGKKLDYFEILKPAESA